MKRALKVILTAFFIQTAIVSLVFSICSIVIRVQRSDWIITTAEITFVGLPDGTVFGTFMDNNGVVHTDQAMYTDDKFMPAGLIKGPPRNDPEPYIGKTVKIMYDPMALNMDNGMEIEADIDSYDKWLRGIIVLGSALGVSAAFLIVIFIYDIKERGKLKCLT